MESLSSSPPVCWFTGHDGCDRCMGALSAMSRSSALFNSVDWEQRFSTHLSQSLESISVVVGERALLVTAELGEEWQLDRPFPCLRVYRRQPLALPVVDVRSGSVVSLPFCQ